MGQGCKDRGHQAAVRQLQRAGYSVTSVRRTAAKTAVGTFLPCQPLQQANNWRRKLRYVRISNAMTLKRRGHGKRKRADTRSYKHGPARPAIFSID